MKARKIKDKYYLTGKETYGMRGKLKRYGCKWDADTRAWVCDRDALETVQRYLKKFKGVELDVFGKGGMK